MEYQEGQLRKPGREHHFINADKVLGVRSGHVAVIAIEDSTRHPSGLVIPEEAKQRDDRGVVLVRAHDVHDLRVGDHVIFSGYSGTKITTRGQGTLIIMPADEILAILPDQYEVLVPYSFLRNSIESIRRRLEAQEEPGGIKSAGKISPTRVVDWFREEIESYSRRGFEF